MTPITKEDGQKMKKKKKKTKLSTRNEIASNYSTANPLKCNTQLISVSPKKILYSETSDKYLNCDKTENTYLHKDKFSTHISIANISEVEKGLTLLKKKKKKKKGDKKREQNNKKIKKKKAALKSNEFNAETCDDICKNLSKDIIGATNLNKDELTTCISISNATEGDDIEFILKKNEKKMKSKKKMFNNNSCDYNKVILKTEQNQKTQSNKDCKAAFGLNECKKKIRKANKDKAVTNITTPITSINEDEYIRLKKIVKKIKKEKKEKKKNQQIQLINNLKNENDPIHTKKRVYSKKKLDECNEMLLDFNEPFKKMHNLAATSLCTDYVNVLKSPSKKFNKSKIATEEEIETSKDETKNKIHKKKKYLNRVIADDCSKEMNIDTEMINSVHNSRISKVHKDPSKLLHKLSKKKKAIKAEEVSTGKMLTKKLNKSERQATAKEYSANSYPRSVDMADKRPYNYNNDRVSREDGTIADTDLYFSRNYGKESNISNSSSTNHENVRVEKSSFECDVCFKTFISKSKLCVHYRTHTGEKPFACDVCGRSFIAKGDLVRHNRTHTGEKPFACDVCGRSFSQKTNLVIHYRTHNGEKPFACDVCGRSFARKPHLALHYRTHTGEKPYACDVCGRSFTQKTSLVLHYRTHTGEKPFACDVCG
ncbi:zinc finger protein ZFP2-like [Aphis gossypii]|uniref:zinc finger protein ZFP2-like n=1 Tax=Aphis gossypii TaxID=80765 RepID=UPI002158D57B|nr:zinc finger protein ZFP2-like [Aphis gossypii]